jgi:hypothetical protein
MIGLCTPASQPAIVTKACGADTLVKLEIAVEI